MHPLQKHRFTLKRPTGFGLVETLLVVGVISVASLAVYGLFFSSDVAAEVKTEQNNLNTLSSSIDRAFGLSGSFSRVSMETLSAEKLLPNAYSASGLPSNSWGGGVSARPYRSRVENDSFVIEYTNVPADACSRLASAMAPNVYGLNINGASVIEAVNGFSPASAAQACANPAGSRMEFIYYSGLVSGGAVATTSIALPPSAPSVNPTNPATPVGPVGGAPEAPDATPGTPGTPTPGVPGVPPPLAPTPPPAAVTIPGSDPVSPPLPFTPPPLVARCNPRGQETQTQTVACPAGTYGTIQQTRLVTYSCPEAWDTDVPTTHAWTNSGGGCTSCPAGGAQSMTQWVGVNAGCPAGSTGSNTWEKEQRSTRSYSYSCPAGTTTAPAPIYGGWQAWSDTGATRNQVNTCRVAVSCPAGQSWTGGYGWKIVYNSGDGYDPQEPGFAQTFWVPGISQEVRAAAIHAFNSVTQTWAFDDGQGNTRNEYAYNRGATCDANGAAAYLGQAETGNYHECVSEMGNHACDYQFSGAWTTLAVCQPTCQ